MKIKLLAVITLLTIVLSCSKKTGTATQELLKDVYVSGYQTSLSSALDNGGIVWKNGTVIQKLNGGYSNIYFNSVFVSDTNIYVAGCQGIFSQNMTGKLWKNGVATSLTSYIEAEGTCVFVSGNDVYVSCYDRNNSYISIAKIWKNGVLTNLTPDLGYNSQNAGASSVYIYGTDEYVAGYAINLSRKKAIIWKNKIATVLTDGSNTAEAKSVFVTGTDVYVVGYENKPSSSVSIAKLWKNGIASSLSTGISSAEARSVYVSGNDVYIAGVDFIGAKSIARLWKNGTATTLSNTATSGEANSVYVAGNDVYVAGWEGVGSYAVATLWKNGVRVPLENGTVNVHSIATSVFVKQ